MKRWILKTFFKDYMMMAFKDAHNDLIETMRDDLDKQAEEMAKERLSKLLSLVDMDKIVTIDKQKGIVFIGGKRVEDARLANLKAEAEALLKFDIWQLIQETPKELAHKAMFIHGEDIYDLRKGRSMLYTLSSQRNIVDIFNSYEPKK